jgi:hypothetical protein
VEAMTPSDRAEKNKKAEAQPILGAIPSLQFFEEIDKGKKREIRRQIACDFYKREDVLRETARKVIESGDLRPHDDV